jgi:hypothetical protein
MVEEAVHFMVARKQIEKKGQDPKVPFKGIYL